MHPTALDNYLRFVNTHVIGKMNHKLKVLDVGAFDVNGTLKPITMTIPDVQYTGMDMCAGANVDVVGDNHKMPFEDNSFDIIISSSCFEHDEMFWVTIKEMERVVKTGGLIYINAPSAGVYHGYPTDCWRFYKDSWAALEKWCDKLTLIESYVDDRPQWCDSIGIYRKK